MSALRCTARLRRRLGLGELPEPRPGGATLGDWYAHLLTVDRQPLVLAVSERSLLAVVLPARDLKNLRRHFLRAVRGRLERVGVGEAAVEAEVARLQPLAYGVTRSRSVLGSINDFVFQLKARAAHPLGRDWTPQSFEDELGEIPCSPLGYEHPAAVARRLLAAESRVLRGPWGPTDSPQSTG
ncbi:MAG: hypothetical protein F9K16_00235 [Thermoanaerobaculia bacterium]|nr:MAG: hypothetical protein F9K16_00235 [Thermoanaerobaculia bacterium]MBZ0103417.1 hypothetical protein [Thermoanaerobaculia bacterium]